MLSRVADGLYWMSRYLERAEHTARLIGVGLNLMLDQTPESVEPRWRRLLAALRTDTPPQGLADAYAITRTLTFDPENPNAIVNCIALARENARQVRQQISSEMWEQVNRLYLSVRAATPEQVWQGEPIEFYQAIKEGAHLFQGITDSTMSHGEGWYFIQVGRYLERAGATALLLDVHFRPYLEAPDDPALMLEYNDWVGLLKCATAFEAYCKVYTADVQPHTVAEFLLLDAEFPHSVRFAADRVQRGLQVIAQSAGIRGGGRAERLAGRLRASLDYGQVEEIMADNMHAYLDGIQRQCIAIHSAIYQTYVTYPVEKALDT
ncbi:MAG: alpha-E domain-containing protein [Oscillochloridaceae bacterium]|nr:alpha-E domain-containing protein [Chloroflexaceae bacterium]MDW8390223.1 alpha-E domain-containing protein [Oscillochloridaceae bacterium]